MPSSLAAHGIMHHGATSKNGAVLNTAERQKDKMFSKPKPSKRTVLGEPDLTDRPGGKTRPVTLSTPDTGIGNPTSPPEDDDEKKDDKKDDDDGDPPENVSEFEAPLCGSE